MMMSETIEYTNIKNKKVFLLLIFYEMNLFHFMQNKMKHEGNIKRKILKLN